MTSAVLNPELYDTIVLAGVRSPGKVTLSGHDRKIKWDVKEGKGLVGATTTLQSVPPIEFQASFYLADEDDKAAWPAFVALIKSTITPKKKTTAEDPNVAKTRKALAAVELRIRASRQTTQAKLLAIASAFFVDDANKEELQKAQADYDAAQKAAAASVSAPLMNALDIFHPYLAENDITSVCEAQVGGGVDDGKGGVTYVIRFQEYKPPKPQTGTLLGSGSNAKSADPNQAALNELDALRKKWEITPWG